MGDCQDNCFMRAPEGVVCVAKLSKRSNFFGVTSTAMSYVREAKFFKRPAFCGC